MEQESLGRAASRRWRSKGVSFDILLGTEVYGYYLEAFDEFTRYELEMDSCSFVVLQVIYVCKKYETPFKEVTKDRPG